MIAITFVLLIRLPVWRSLIATTSAAPASTALPIDPQRLSSTNSSRKTFASSSRSRQA